REENRAIVGAIRRAEYSNHRQRILGHLLALVEPITDLQARLARSVGAQHGLVRGLLERIGAEEPPPRDREDLPTPGEASGVVGRRRHVTEALVRVAHRDRDGDLDTRVAL